jgi:hypothetical protein
MIIVTKFGVPEKVDTSLVVGRFSTSDGFCSVDVATCIMHFYLAILCNVA